VPSKPSPAPTERRPGIRTPVFLIVALVVADIGASIPYGIASGPYSNTITGQEWVLAGIEAASVIALALRLAGVLKPHRDAWPLALSAGAWTFLAFYSGFLIPDATVRYRIGLGLIFTGYAFAASICYAREIAG
jgi:hypothetical protein